MLQILGGNGDPIDSVATWLNYAPPVKGVAHWVDGHSAKELAKAWCRKGHPSVPAELQSLLDASPVTRGVQFSVGLAERVTRLDQYPGGHRNHDLLLVGQQGQSPPATLVIGIEAKASERFDTVVSKKYEEGEERLRNGDASNLCKRVDQLVDALFKNAGSRRVELFSLRYQLLTATAGTIIEAASRGANKAILVVHQFVTAPQQPGVFSDADVDFSDFLGALAEDGDLRADDGVLYGPFTVPGGGRIPANFEIWLGKLRSIV